MNEPMSPSFAVFNPHVNHAGAKADAQFILMFGQKKFDRYIKPRWDEGIMTIFHHKPNIYTSAWVAMVTVLVNERHAPSAFKAAIADYDKKLAELAA